MRGKQGSKDSSTKRDNLDNVRVSKLGDDIAKRIVEDGKKINANDGSYYTRNPELVNAACTIPFAPILGETSVENGSVPGIMILPWTQNFGTDTKPLALNQMSDSVYSFVVHKNSRNYQYTAPDLTLVTLAGMDVFKLIASMIRGYGSAKAYAEENAYMPDAILAAQGFYPIDVRQNLSKMWFDINLLIDRSRQIWIPNNYPIMKRQFDLNTFIYTDAPDGVKSQIYIPVQSTYYIWSETGVNTGSALSAVGSNGMPYMKPTVPEEPEERNIFDPAHNQYTWDTWMTVANAMIDALINSEDRGIMYGDMLNAYGAESLYALPPVTSDYTVRPEYNAEVLMQIENTVCMPGSTNYRQLGLVQYEEDLYPVWNAKQSGHPLIPSTVTLNFHTQTKPDPLTVMIATRNTMAGVRGILTYEGDVATWPASSEAPAAKHAVPGTAGSEIFMAPIILCYQLNGTTFQRELSRTEFITAFTQLSQLSNVRTDNRLMAFDWHPFRYELVDTTSGWVNGYYPISTKESYGDFDNYTSVSIETLNKMHTVAIFSEWGVPIL